MIKSRRWLTPSVPHQCHQHAGRGCCDRQHDGYCESAQIRPVSAPVRGLRRRRYAVMHSTRGGVRAGRQGHECTFSRSATTHHTRAEVRRPTVRPDRSGLRASGRAEGQVRPAGVRPRRPSLSETAEPAAAIAQPRARPPPAGLLSRAASAARSRSCSLARC